MLEQAADPGVMARETGGAGLEPAAELRQVEEQRQGSAQSRPADRGPPAVEAGPEGRDILHRRPQPSPIHRLGREQPKRRHLELKRSAVLSDLSRHQRHGTPLHSGQPGPLGVP